MRLLWWVLAAIALIVIVVAVVGALLPHDHVVSRTILLAASPDRVRDLIVDVQRYPSWRSGITRVVTQLPPLSDGPRIRWREFLILTVIVIDLLTEQLRHRLSAVEGLQ